MFGGAGLKKSPHRLLGPFLKTQRLHQNVSRKELAQLLGCTEQFILNFEHGVCSPPGPMVKRLIEILKLNPNEVLEILFQESLQEWHEVVPSSTVKDFAKRLRTDLK
jgi:transcriptional regulator with XRE-family HTH domain